MSVLVVLGLYSCGENTPEIEPGEENTPEIEKPIFPLNIGNSWTYEETTHAMTNPEVETVKSEMNNVYTIDGQSGFSARKYVKGEPISLLNNDNEGNCIEYLFNNDKLVHKTIIFKKNIKKGDKWIYKSAVYTDGDFSQYKITDMEKTCIASDTIITTPKGDFKCVVFSYNPSGAVDKEGNPNDVFVQFLSENVGLVKFQRYELQNLFSERILTDYTIKDINN
ncbi:hypothetical protein AGMMS4957_11970 [Bacteroidia bacterium]|nr:hypothetical protein AGMMS4957_11970 [Bacteroidia bacterium]